MKNIKENYYFIVLLAVCVSFAWFQLDRLSTEEEYVEIVINEGDTLWGLAADYSEQMSVDHWISEVRQLNGLAADEIKTGESLRLPAKMMEDVNFRMTEVGEGAR